MADSLRPLTLLLAAVCLWALGVLVLGLAGLGSRFAPAEAGAAAPALPKVNLTRTESRLGPIGNYLEVGQRPLLSADRRPGLAPAAGGEGSGELDVVLTSVLITPRLQLAIFTDNKDASSRRVRLGEMVTGSNWRLVQLEPRRAVLEGPSGQRELGLRVFDGKGGQSPTNVVTAVPAQAAGNDAAARPESAADAAPPSPTPSPAPPQAVTSSNDAKPDQGSGAALTQEQQVEAIRRRIEARRAQMRAEAAAAAAQKK